MLKGKKVRGIVALVAGIILLLIGLGFLVFGTYLQGSTVDEYDKWAKEENRTPGDEITVTGVLAKEETLHVPDFGNVYSYQFEGSDQNFLSSEDIGNVGDTVTVTIEIDPYGFREATSVTKINVQLTCLLPGILMIIIGIVSLIWGIVMLRRSKKEGEFGPPQYPPPQYVAPRYQTDNQYGQTQNQGSQYGTNEGEDYWERL